MLCRRELIALKKDKKYKWLKSIFFTLKYTKGAWNIPDINIDMEYSFNKEFYTSASVPVILLVNLFKHVIIAKEIAVIRNGIIETSLNLDITTFNIQDVFKNKHCIWGDFSQPKVEKIKNACKDFLQKAEVQDIIINKCVHIDDEKEKIAIYNNFIVNLDCKFREIIKECADRDLYSSALGICVSCYGEEAIVKSIEKNAHSGNLTNNSNNNPEDF